MIYRAIVADNRDPADAGRLRVMIPALSGPAISDWVWPLVASGYAYIPAAGDQVWISFENGDKDFPVWLGTTQQSETAPILTHSHSDGIGAPIPQSSVVNLTSNLASLSSRVSATESGVASISTKAPLASPALTGTPTAPTASAGTSTTQLATTAFVMTAVNQVPLTTTGSTSVPITSSHVGSIIATTATGGTVTVALPPDSTNIAVGSQITFIQRGTSQIVFSAGSGVTIEATPGLKTRTRYSVATATKVAANTWSLYGDLTV